METTWCPPRRLRFGRSAPVAECEGRAMARRCVAPEGVRCDLSVASHGSSPPFVRRVADNPWSACAQDGASPHFGFHSVRNRFRIRHSIQHSIRIRFGLHPRTEAFSAGPRPRCRQTAVRSRWPSCPTWLGESHRRRLREGAWRSRGGRGLPRNAELILRRSEDKKEESIEITAWKLPHGVCLGEGAPDLRSCR